MKLSPTFIDLLISRVDLNMPKLKTNLNTFIDCPVLNKQAAELQTVDDLKNFITAIDLRLQVSEDRADHGYNAMRSLIFSGWNWEASPEGHDFWQTIYRAFLYTGNHSQALQRAVHLCETMCYTDLVDLTLAGFEI